MIVSITNLEHASKAEGNNSIVELVKKIGMSEIWNFDKEEVAGVCKS